MFPTEETRLVSTLSAKSLSRAMSKSLLKVNNKIYKGARDSGCGYWEHFCQSQPSLSCAVQAVLDKVLHGGPRANMCGLFVPSTKYTLMSVPQLRKLLRHCVKVLLKEPTLVTVQAPCKLFGDIHGQFQDLMSFFQLYGSPSHRNGDINLAQYVFMGDFVDRGAHGLEVVTVLLCLKARYPQRIVLIRGNHETAALNEVYGFMDECFQRLGTELRRDAEQIFNGFQNVFAALPLAALVEGKILCVHGGIGTHVTTLEDIAAIARPVPDPTEKLEAGDDYASVLSRQEQVIVDLLWSDPRDKVQEYGRVSARGAGSYFDTDDVYAFCKRTGVQLIVRAHECVPNGYALWARGRCLTLFSAPDYCGRHGNAGAMLEISRTLRVHVKTVQSSAASGTWANTRDATPPPSPREIAERVLSDDDDDDEVEEVVRFEDHMLAPISAPQMIGPIISDDSDDHDELVEEVVRDFLLPVTAAASTKDIPIDALNANDTMIVLRSRNVGKYSVGARTRLGTVFAVDRRRSAIIIKARTKNVAKAKQHVRWFHAPDVATYRHRESLLDGRATVVAIDVSNEFVFWRFNERSSGYHATSPPALGKTKSGDIYIDM